MRRRGYDGLSQLAPGDGRRNLTLRLELANRAGVGIVGIVDSVRPKGSTDYWPALPQSRRQAPHARARSPTAHAGPAPTASSPCRGRACRLRKLVSGEPASGRIHQKYGGATQSQAQLSCDYGNTPLRCQRDSGTVSINLSQVFLEQSCGKFIESAKASAFC